MELNIRDQFNEKKDKLWGVGTDRCRLAPPGIVRWPGKGSIKKKSIASRFILGLVRRLRRPTKALAMSTTPTHLQPWQ
jgi:hypothetical protein